MSTSEPAARSRRGNLEGSEPRQRKDGRWQANYPVGIRANGSMILQSVYGKTKAECRAKARELATKHANGQTSTTKAPRLLEWLHYFIDRSEADKRLRPRTANAYRSKVDNYVQGHRVARKRLTALTADDLRAIYEPMREKKLSESTVAYMHRIIRRALNVAIQDGILARNPAERMDAPQQAAFEPQVYTTEEVRRMVQVAQGMDDGARMMLNLTLGPRQGEALGLSWPDVDFAKNRIRIVREVYTLPWKHGCAPDGGVPVCGRKRGDGCPERKGGGYFSGPPKSASGKRSAPMPAQLAEALKEHREVQFLQRSKDWAPWVDQDGVEHDLVFCRPNGQPIHYRADWQAWKDFLKSAGVADGRVHDGRHTAATALLLLGIDARVVMEILGWSQMSMLSRYQHILEEMQDDVADRLSAHLEAPAAEPSNVISLADRLARKIVAE